MEGKLATDINNQTPIEILLQIDEDGTVSSKKVYSFLELHPAHYSKWCKTNISENEFAEENIDYRVFTLESENPKGGRPSTDYKLSVSFAKKLCMLQKNKRGEQARDYFLKVEDKLKEVTQLQPPADTMKPKVPAIETDANMILIEAMVAKLKSHNNDIVDLKERVTEIEKAKYVDPVSVNEVVPNTLNEKPSLFVRNNVYSSGAIAKGFGLGSRTLNNLLAKEGVLRRVQVYYERSQRLEGYWIVTDKYRNLKYSAQRYAGVSNPGDYKPIEITYGWTPKGVGFIINLLKYKGFIQHEDITNRTKSRTWKKGSRGGVRS